MSLYKNIHAKRKRIKAGSGEKMRKAGQKGRPTAKHFKEAKKNKENLMKKKVKKVITGLKKASKLHAKQAKTLASLLKNGKKKNKRS